MADAIQFNVDAALQKVADLIQQHGKEAVDTAMSVEQVSGATILLQNTALAALGGALALGAWKLLLKGRVIHAADEGFMHDASWPAFISGGVIALAAFVTLLTAGTGLLDVWNWIYVFNPKLGLAHDIMLRFAGIG